MKTNKNICLTAVLGIALFASCKKETIEINHTPAVKIQFAEGGDTSIVHVQKGATSYPVKINISSNGSVIRLFELYTADSKTGNKESLIAGTAKTFANPVDTYSTTYDVSGLTDDRAIKVMVTDTLDRVYEKNILIKITPSVMFTDAVKIETAENYYGPYFASWLSGRVYMRNTPYVSQIDFSLGDVIITGGAATAVPALVNPSLRKSYNLLTTEGLQSTKFALTSLSMTNYNAITKVDATPITTLTDPTLDAVALQPGKVYVFKTANGKKGLIGVTAVSSKTGTIENVNGKWESTSYSEVTLSTKYVAQ